MIDCIKQIVNFAGALIMKLYEIPIVGNLNIGTTIIILILCCLLISIFMGRRGD